MRPAYILSRLPVSALVSAVENQFAKRRIMVLGDSRAQGNFANDASISSITSSGLVATVVGVTDIPTGTTVRVGNCTDNAYNGRFTVTRTGVATYQYTMRSLPASTTAVANSTGIYVVLENVKGSGGWFNWLNSMTGGGFDISCGAIAGGKASDLDWQITNILVPALPIEWALIEAGVNDVNALGSVSRSLCDTIITNITAAATRCAALGLNVMLCTVASQATGGSSYSANAMQNILYINQKLRQWAQTAKAVYLIDVNAALIDPASTTQAWGPAGATQADYEIDASGQHPSPLGSFRISQRLLGENDVVTTANGKSVVPMGNGILGNMNDLIRKLPTDIVLASSAAEDIWVNTGATIQLMKNPLFNVGTAGTLQGGFTGTAATGWNISGNSVTTCACSLTTRADGWGKNQAVAFVLAGGGNLSIGLDNGGGNGAAGKLSLNDRIYATCEIVLCAPISGDFLTGTGAINLSGLLGVDLRFICNMGGIDYSNYASADMLSVTTSAAKYPQRQTTDGAPLVLTLRTPVFTVTSATIARIDPYLFINGSGAGSAGTISVGRFGLFKV